MKRPCNAKIVATLGPASADRGTIEALVRAGADVFRLNFSHGTHADHRQRLDLIRAIETDIGRPIGVLLDLQGPKLRVGTFSVLRVTVSATTISRCPSLLTAMTVLLAGVRPRASVAVARGCVGSRSVSKSSFILPCSNGKTRP